MMGLYEIFCLIDTIKKRKKFKWKKPSQENCLDQADYWYKESLDAYLDIYEKENSELFDPEAKEIQRWAANHIGFFLTWIIQHHFEGEAHIEEIFALDAVRREEMSGVEFFLTYCNGMLWESDFSKEIYPFVQSYYPKYYTDYAKWVEHHAYYRLWEFEGEWKDYHEFEPVLDKAYAVYQAKHHALLTDKIV